MARREHVSLRVWTATATVLPLVLVACLVPGLVAPTPSPTQTAWDAAARPTFTPWLPTATYFQACTIRLDQATLESLATLQEPSIQMRAGDTMILSLYVPESWPMAREVEACVTWSVEPQVGASITAEGELSIDPTAPHGSIFTVTANVENGRRLISVPVHIYDPAQNPLIGGWTEESQFACGTQVEVQPQEHIGSLVFYADGRMSVTWFPFESYVDYTGTYSTTDDGRMEMAITWGAYAPSDFDGVGTYSIDAAGDLLLQDVWLGSSKKGLVTANCGHRFTRD